MSADLLREAAALMRRQHEDRFMFAVAAWLDSVAEQDDLARAMNKHGIGPDAPSAVVARAYLGRDS